MWRPAWPPRLPRKLPRSTGAEAERGDGPRDSWAERLGVLGASRGPLGLGRWEVLPWADTCLVFWFMAFWSQLKVTYWRR